MNSADVIPYEWIGFRLKWRSLTWRIPYSVFRIAYSVLLIIKDYGTLMTLIRMITRDWEIAVTITPMKPVVQARLGNRGYNNPHEAGGASAIGKSRLQ